MYSSSSTTNLDVLYVPVQGKQLVVEDGDSCLVQGLILKFKILMRVVLVPLFEIHNCALMLFFAWSDSLLSGFFGLVYF